MESLRRLMNWNYLSWARDRWGARFALAHWDRKLVRIPTDATERHHVYLRPNTADLVVYDEVFRALEYDLDLGDDPKLIIDAGAHIGLASVYFALRYPNARIVAIEPEPSNYRLLLRHAALYPNIMPIQAGLWNRPAKLSIANPQADTWSFRVVEAPQGIQAISIDGIALLLGATTIDLLKMDIEGSEVEVLNASAPWLGKVLALVVELHERFKPGCLEALEQATRHGNWRRSKSGESEVLVRVMD